MSCRNIRKRLSAYQDRELSSDEQVRIKSHLQGCPECSALYAAFQHTWEVLGEVPEIAPAPAFYPALRRKIAGLNDLNLVPMVFEDNRVIAFSNKTLFNGNNIGLQEYPIVRVFDWIGKVFMNFFNDVAFQKFDKKLREGIWEEIVEFLNDYKGKLFEDYTFDRDGIKQDSVTKDISISVNIKPFFAAKNFYIKLSGHDGKDGREWDQEVD